MIAGIAIGALLGGAVAGLTAWLVVRQMPIKTERTDREVPALLEEDRNVISEEFAAHAVAVRKQVSEYADMLAGEDPVLRERLRQFEGEGQPC